MNIGILWCLRAALGECSLPGCRVLAQQLLVDAVSIQDAYQYCSATHEQMDFPRRVGKSLIPLQQMHFEYQSVLKQTISSWKTRKGKHPQILAICRIEMPEPVVRAYNRYRDSVARRDPMAFQRGGTNSCEHLMALTVHRSW